MQGYLTKMPSEWVRRWSKLSALEGALAGTQSRLEALGERIAPLSSKTTTFNWKSAADYLAVLRGGIQRRTRGHEALVRFAGETLQAAGATVATPHPIDLLVTEPLEVIIEAKAVGSRHCGFAIRDAIGQLHEYRHFIGPRAARLCVLLDEQPSEDLVRYVEAELGMMILWRTESALTAGENTQDVLGAAGVVLG